MKIRRPLALQLPPVSPQTSSQHLQIPSQSLQAPIQYNQPPSASLQAPPQPLASLQAPTVTPFDLRPENRPFQVNETVGSKPEFAKRCEFLLLHCQLIISNNYPQSCPCSRSSRSRTTLAPRRRGRTEPATQATTAPLSGERRLDPVQVDLASAVFVSRRGRDCCLFLHFHLFLYVVGGDNKLCDRTGVSNAAMASYLLLVFVFVFDLYLYLNSVCIYISICICILLSVTNCYVIGQVPAALVSLFTVNSSAAPCCASCCHAHQTLAAFIICTTHIS